MECSPDDSSSWNALQAAEALGLGSRRALIALLHRATPASSLGWACRIASDLRPGLSGSLRRHH